jgi:hypothetical protein
VKRIAVERKRGVAAADFVRDHLQGSGVPVVITDAMERWPARSKWSLEYFKAAYGSDFAPVSVGLRDNVIKMTKLATFIDYMGDPTVELPGFWLERSSGKALRTPPDGPLPPHYLTGWHAFRRHPELYDDIVPSLYFIDDWQRALTPTMRDIFEWTSDREYFSIYLGPEGSLSQLHQDYWRTHSCLSQIQGRKRCILFAPQDSEFLYGGAVDPERPDPARFEHFERATAYECVIGPGDTLFTPPDWWHDVRALDNTITVSHNFFNAANVNEHLTGILGRLPRLIEGFDKFPSWREELGIRWPLNIP